MVLFNPFFNCDRCRIILHHPCILRFQKLHLGIAFRTLHKPAHCCLDCSCRFGLYRCECWFILSILTFLFIFHLPQPADTTSELLEYRSHSSTTTTAASRLGSILVLWRRWYTTLRHWWTFTLAFPTSFRRCCRRSGCFGAEWEAAKYSTGSWPPTFQSNPILQLLVHQALISLTDAFTALIHAVSGGFFFCMTLIA